MAIPKDILALKPKNTRVKATSKPNEYNVIKRTCILKDGKPMPKELGTVGKIIDGKYIPLANVKYDVEFKTYGTVAIVEKVSKEIFYDLCKFYPVEDAKKLYVIALLRSINEDIKDEEINVEYQTSFASEFYPKLGISSNTISQFLEKIGKKTTLIEEFMNDRIKQYSGHPMVIDGMLKSNTSETNIYSEYSRKGRIRGIENINLIYAYDLSNKEPVASAPYEGNMLDFTAFRDFIETYPIENGFIIMDKGFDESISKEQINNLNTKYIIPIKNSSSVIKENELNKNFKSCFKFEEDSIRCKKVQIGNKYYFAFKSSEMKSTQDKSYINRTLKRGEFSEQTYQKKEEYFGLIIFESNADFELKDIYKAYKQRWEIECLFAKYKNIINRTEENVHGTYRLMSSEFINFLSCIMISRVKKLLNTTELQKQYSLPVTMRYLSKYVKKRAPRRPTVWVDVAMLKYIKNICSILHI